MQLDFFEKPKRTVEKPSASAKVVPKQQRLVDAPSLFYQKPKPYSVIKQGYTTTIWNEEVRNS